MSAVLEQYSFSKRGRSASYDWSLFLDGQIHQLVAGDDFQCKPESFRNAARQQATKQGKGLNTAVEGDTVVIQSYVPEPEPAVAE